MGPISDVSVNGAFFFGLTRDALVWVYVTQMDKHTKRSRNRFTVDDDVLDAERLRFTSVFMSMHNCISKEYYHTLQ